MGNFKVSLNREYYGDHLIYIFEIHVAQHFVLVSSRLLDQISLPIEIHNLIPLSSGGSNWVF